MEFYSTEPFKYDDGKLPEDTYRRLLLAVEEEYSIETLLPASCGFHKIRVYEDDWKKTGRSAGSRREFWEVVFVVYKEYDLAVLFHKQKNKRYRISVREMRVLCEAKKELDEFVRSYFEKYPK